MGFIMNPEGFDQVLAGLREQYRIFAPVKKIGEGRFTDTDVIRYDYVECLSDIELETRSDYSFKDSLLPLSETLFFFTEKEIKAADFDDRPIVVLLRSCDIHALKRLDQMYMDNGPNNDYFYQRRREGVRFALIGCGTACENSFCATMGTRLKFDFLSTKRTKNRVFFQQCSTINAFFHFREIMFLSLSPIPIPQLMERSQ